MNNRRQYTIRFKRKVIKHYIADELPLKSLLKLYDIDKTTFNRWVNSYLDGKLKLSNGIAVSNSPSKTHRGTVKANKRRKNTKPRLPIPKFLKGKNSVTGFKARLKKKEEKCIMEKVIYGVIGLGLGLVVAYGVTAYDVDIINSMNSWGIVLTKMVGGI